MLSKNDILFIEVIFRNFIKEYKYSFDNKLSFFKILRSYISLLFIFQHQEKYYINKYLIIIRNVLRRMAILIFKEKSANIFKFK